MLTIQAKFKKMIVLLLLVLSGTTSFAQISSAHMQEEVQIDSVLMFRELAFKAAKTNDAETAAVYIDKYVKRTLDFHFVEHSSFNYISEAPAYQSLVDQYVPQFKWIALFYIYSGLIGFFIVLIINIRKKKDQLAALLLSLFLLIHSVFIIHVGLYTMNYTFELPHTQSMSTVFSFLYGPLLYFYFRRIKTGYKPKWIDALHLLPTLALVVMFLPIYALSAEEKLRMMLGLGNYSSNPYGQLVAVGKILSLVVYATLTLLLFLRTRTHRTQVQTPLYVWQRNIVGFQILYALVYLVYGILLMADINTGPVFNSQLILMSGMVLYVAYVAYSQPKVLMGFHLESNYLKYKNSGLTNSYSLELKNQLVNLLDEEKIYRENDINLDSLADRLGTTRHSASQIINEHFGQNFFELINSYRIKEAMEILKADTEREKNIIDVAYEVGFNNKVTFNKSFKKINEVTPSQYVKALYS